MMSVRLVIFTLLTTLSTLAYSAPFGINFSYVLAPRELDDLHGAQVMFNYHPESMYWPHFNLYFDAGFSHFWVYHTNHHSRINIISIAPIFRFLGYQIGNFLPYVEASVGVAYMSSDHMANRNLGMCYSFQDRLGVGVLVGRHHEITLGLHALHYSNANTSSHNSGFTAPVVLDIGYTFG